MKMKILFVLIASITLISTNANAQNIFSNMQAEVETWKSDALTADDTPSKAKQKKVKYDNYTLETFFVKDDLVLGQPISIVDAGKSTLLSGKVLSIETPVSVQGIANDGNGNEKLGTFEISNTSDGSLSFKPRQSDALIIKCTSLSYIIASDAGNPVIINTQSKTLATRDNSSRNGYESLSAGIPTSIQPDGQVEVGSILSSLSSKVLIQWEDRTFEGKVKAEGSSPVKFITLSGKCSYDNGKTVSVSQSGSTLTMNVTDPSGNTESYVIPTSNLDEQLWWSEKDFIKQAELYKKQQEEARKASASSKTASSGSVASLKSNQSTSSSPSSSSSSDDDSDKGVIFILVAVIIYILYKIISWWHSKKCPHCGKRFCLRTIDEEDLGITKSKREKQSDGSYATIHYHKVKYIKQCKHCGGIVNVIDIVKED